jgi:ubiquitin-protein ligase E3 C
LIYCLIESDSSDDDEDEDRDIVMKEAATPVISPTQSNSKVVVVPPMIRARLELLYDSERVNTLLYRFMHLATSVTNSSEAIQSISSFFNTLMLRWPMKKDTILNTLLYKSANTHLLLQILWNSWSTSYEAVLFKNDKNIMDNLSEAVKSITGNFFLFLKR